MVEIESKEMRMKWGGGHSEDNIQILPVLGTSVFDIHNLDHLIYIFTLNTFHLRIKSMPNLFILVPPLGISYKD